ncbi:uncharacterized protein LOC141782493 isoform X2 [Sebastes fasciatus]|uniref:uncharacterized protein LOC141782493 isoform X2 n=1 Tax=Sebastes fasciatus TaxID=394691 RepID=UPI003D9E120D
MKTLALLSLSLAVALGMPPIAPGVAQNPVLTEEDQIPLQRDWVPVQGHVVVEDPAPQVRPGSEEHQEKLAAVPVDTEQNMVELEIKVKPQVGEEHEGEVKTEVKKEPEVKPEPEVKAEPEVEVKQELKAEPEVKPEPDVKAEPEVNVEQKLKAEPEVEPVPDVKAEPEVNVEQKLKAEPEVKPEPDVKAEPEVKVEQKLKAEPEVETEPDDKAEPEVNVEQKLKAEPEAKPEPDVKAEQEVEVEQELKAEPEVKEEFQVQMNLEAETETGQEIEERHIDMEGKSEMVGEPNMELEPLDDDNMELSEEEESLRAAFTNQDHVIQPLPEEEGLMRERNNLDGEPIMELEPEVKSEVDVEPDVQEEFQGEMNLEEGTETGQEIEERHIDMEGKSEMEEPIMELEPLDDDNTEMSDTEKSLRAAFQNQDPVNQPLSEEEEEEGVMRKRDNVLDGEPIMELEPEEEEPSLHQHVMPDAAIMYGSGPALDIMGQQMPSLEEYFPNEEARMGMEPGKQQDSRTEGSDYLMMEEPGSEFVREEELSPMALFEEPDMNYGPALDGGVQIGVAPKRERRALMMNGKSHCPGVILEEKCYQFFKEPKRAADAEFFCQEHFAGGHLASITSQHIHREVMNMMLRQNGAYTRTWIGGLRFLETGRFLWLDGSRWSYADWLSGEPNNTSDVEDCVEVLAHGNGKFNDFTCREPQAFICSYPY